MTECHCHSTSRTLDCGARVVVEPMPSVASLAIRWLLPIGSATDAADGDGQAAMLSEMIFRGAGELNSRQHSDALDRLGVDRGSGVNRYHMPLSFTLLGDRLDDALPLIVDLVRRPLLPDDAIEPVRSLCLQSLEGLPDDPQHLVMLRLRERHDPPPLNRHGYGDETALRATTMDDLRNAWASRCVPQGAIVSAAGAVDPGRLIDQLNERLSGWCGEIAEPKESAPAARGHLHLAEETNQVHIAAAWDAPAEPDDDSMLQRLAMAVLSGGSSARLFTEVRQKRSLCYSVGASYRGGRDRGRVTLYAGTTPDRAQETLDVCLAEFARLREGASQDEFDRAIVGLKSRLIMHGEATRARASALAGDLFRIGRARSLEEIARQIDAITLDQLNAYLARRDFGVPTLVSIGPVELVLPTV